MESNGFSSQQAPIYRSNGTNGASPGALNGRPQPRILTVDEALPYSPFSSVVPFNSNIIPVPSIGLRSSASIFSNPEERSHTRHGLEALNHEARTNNTSVRLQKSLNDLKDLLQPAGIAQFKFRNKPNVASSPEPNELPRLALTPFAKMVYDHTSVEFTYPSPDSPSPPISNDRSTPHKPKQAIKPKSQTPQQSSNQQAYSENSSIVAAPSNGKSKAKYPSPPYQNLSRPNPSFAVVIPTPPQNFRREEYVSSQPVEDSPSRAFLEKKHVPVQPAILPPVKTIKPHPTPSQPSKSSTPISSSQGLAIIIPDLPPKFRSEEYEVIPDEPDTPQHLSRKRRHSSGDSDGGGLSRSVDQREKAEMALQQLRDYLGEIFEAEDQMQPGAVHSSTLFTAAGEGMSLTLSAQTKAESLVQKVITVGRFSQVPLDDLLRLQKLSEYALKDAENVDVKIEESMGEAEIEAWLPQIGIAELGIRAARTSLRIMSGGRDDKQLYSEDLIQSALNAFKNVIETCIIPVVEMRSTTPTASLFKLLSAAKKTITNILSQCRRLFAQMATLVSSIELSETVINTLEFTTSRLIFVENAHSERDSVLGVARFDSLRVVAMDVLAQIFLCNPAQRQGIFDDILTSLEKLPVTKQSARQFKLAEGGSIQLVSALIMRLIQTSAGKSDDGKESRRRKALEALNGDEDMKEDGHAQMAGVTTINSETRGEQQPVTAIQELKEAITPLVDTAKGNAFYVTNFIVNRALKSTKSGDAPYRNLLDLFVEDFITCLNSTDWPAAELLLRLLLFKMVQLAEGEKSPAPAKNMALDLLGLMGAAISELTSNIRKTASSLENTDSDLARYLCRLSEASLEKNCSNADIVSWACGPYRTCLEFLEARASTDGDPQLASAIGFFTAEWASKICTTFDLIDNNDPDHLKVEKEYGRLAYRVRTMVNDTKWLSTEYSFEPVSPPHARLAYSLSLLHSAFCGSFNRVMQILLGSMTSEQATVRSKSLKSVNQVLDTDATILDTDRTVMLLINRCANDSSVQVRDAALGLIGKCIVLRPALEGEMIVSILQRVNDSGVGVRKRAIKLSKDIYLRNMNREVRSQIADSLLHRVTDLDEGVQDLARQAIEEVWMSPFYQSGSEHLSTQFKLAMADHVALMVKTVQRSSGVATVLDKVLQHLLSPDAKFKTANQKVCKALVATMFETIIDNPAGDGDDAPSARDALQILTIFARSNPQLFNADQIQLLEPYIKNVGSTDDMVIYRSVVVIFRHVLPILAKVHHTFLIDVRKELLPAVSRVGKTILDDVIACVWIISEVLGDIQHLTRLVLSSLSGIVKMKNSTLNENDVKKLIKLLPITGMCGKHCNLDPQLEAFRQAFPNSFSDPKKVMDVSRLMVDTFTPFASPSRPAEIRKAALDAIGMVCQSWPKNFSFVNIYTTFIVVFDEQDPALETIIMRAFKDFLTLEEKRSEAGKDGAPNVAAESAAKLGVMGGGQGDGVALGIAQRFLHHIIRVALSRKDDQGLLAAEVVASIARQGLVHPKETGSSLIALETSSNPKIAELAFKEHKALHQKHETILEKEYMRAVQLAYVYQRDVEGDTHGATLNPFVSKLSSMMEVLKISKVKIRRRFYDNLCARIEFDPLKIDMGEAVHQLDFSQFIIENMAFFDYATVDELLSAINAMEKVVASTGTGIAHSIETEIFHVRLEQPSMVDENGQVQVSQPTIDPMRLKLLTASSMLLSCLWEARTYLRKQYGLKSNRQEGKVKGATKDLSRAPVKVSFVNGDKFWEAVGLIMGSMESEGTMMKQCRSFVELLSVDQEFKIAAEADEETEQRHITPSDNEEDGEADVPAAPGSGRGRKRKGSVTPGGRKKIARSSSIGAPRGRGRPKGLGKKQSVDRSDDDGGDW